MTEEELQELYKQRGEAYVALIEEYGLADSEPWTPDEPEELCRYAYVQRKWLPSGDHYWITTHTTPEQAAEYQAGEDGEWRGEVLVDLDRDVRFDVVSSVRFEPQASVGAQPKPAKRDLSDIFVANDDGTFFCSDCVPPEIDVSLDSVQTWQEGSHGWVGQPKCCVCKLSIPVYVDGDAPGGPAR